MAWRIPVTDAVEAAILLYAFIHGRYRRERSRCNIEEQEEQVPLISEKSYGKGIKTGIVPPKKVQKGQPLYNTRSISSYRSGTTCRNIVTTILIIYYTRRCREQHMWKEEPQQCLCLRCERYLHRKNYLTQLWINLTRLWQISAHLYFLICQ